MVALEEPLKRSTANDAGYYESDSANANDAKCESASDLKVDTNTSDRTERTGTDTSNGDLQQKLLSNRNLPITTMTIDPQIDNMVATSGVSPLKLAMPQTMEVIMDAARSSAQILRNLRHVSRTVREIITLGDYDVAVNPPQGNSTVMIGGIGVSLTRGHSGSLDVLNKQQSTSPRVSRNTQKFDASVDKKLANDGYSTSIFSKVIGRELSYSTSADIDFCCRMDFTSNAVRTEAPNLMDFGSRP